jgi:hypothetical protein
MLINLIQFFTLRILLKEDYFDDGYYRVGLEKVIYSEQT